MHYSTINGMLLKKVLLLNLCKQDTEQICFEFDDFDLAYLRGASIIDRIILKFFKKHGINIVKTQKVNIFSVHNI